MPKTSLNRRVAGATNTLHLHFIHHFAVKSALAVCAEVLTAAVWLMRWRRVAMKSKMDAWRRERIVRCVRAGCSPQPPAAAVGVRRRSTLGHRARPGDAHEAAREGLHHRGRQSADRGRRGAVGRARGGDRQGLRLDQPDRARSRRRGADGALDRRARPDAATIVRSIAASSARPTAARRTASAASRSAIPPPIFGGDRARPTSRNAQSSGAASKQGALSTPLRARRRNRPIGASFRASRMVSEA